MLHLVRKYMAWGKYNACTNLGQRDETPMFAVHITNQIAKHLPTKTKKKKLTIKTKLFCTNTFRNKWSLVDYGVLAKHISKLIRLPLARHLLAFSAHFPYKSYWFLTIVTRNATKSDYCLKTVTHKINL